MPPKTAPRLGQRSSMQVSAADQKKLAEEIDAAQETDKKFVSYMTDTLLTRLTGCANLSEARYLRISESDAKIKV